MRCSIAALATALVAGLGCTESSAVITTSPPPDAKLSQLDDEQAVQLCQSLDYRERARAGDKQIKHAVCLIAGGLAAQFADTNDADFDALGTCEQTYDDCIAAKPQSDVDAGESAEQCSSQRFAGCDATVASFRDCQDTALDAFVGALDSLMCADVITMTDAGTPMSNVLDTPACHALYARCPGLAEAPKPKPECSVAIRTTGAVDADVDAGGDGCDSKYGVALDGDDFVELSVWLEDGVALRGVQATLSLVPRSAGYSASHVQVGMVVHSNDATVEWSAAQGCTGDLKTTACKVGKTVGVRYHIENGACDAALPASTNGMPAPALDLASFSLSSACVLPP